MLGYLSVDISCSEKRTVFLELCSRNPVSYKEQIMSKDKCPSIFSPQMEAIFFIILQIFFATHAIFKTVGEYFRIFHSFSWGIFSHVTHLDQSRASKKIWWIIRLIIPQLTLENIQMILIFLNFQNSVCCIKYLKGRTQKHPYEFKNMLTRYLS